ncbi:hypothetical protein VTK73DRAFT_6734 [Phialemonium thermophilum]|uniref:Mitochondrial carrier protein n=1 Tax=Phialemonium thermophilum TaxID=223376 RepID=A0ABR3WIG3_9PEZI
MALENTEPRAAETPEILPSSSDENTPLLKNQARDQIHPVEPGVNNADATSSDEEQGLDGPAIDPEEPAAPRQRTKSWYAWRAFWTVLGALVLGLFIKGWIDADDTEFDLVGALKRALGGGLSGAAAMVLQVLLLMPLRTIMNFQYRYGKSFTEATVFLYREQGLRRYYQGLAAALIQGPVSRFGDTAANAGILALLQSNSYLNRMPTFVKTVFASLCAACFRMVLTPIDTLKTTLQTQGYRGTAILRRRIKTDGIGSLWWGALATTAATFVGHYPWFATYNSLMEAIPEPSKDHLLLWLLRLAFIGFCASVVSDSVSNSLRVVKTYRQVNESNVSYTKAARQVVQADGLVGLFGRGLKTRILCNGLQGLLFSILWKLFLDFHRSHQPLTPDKPTIIEFRVSSRPNNDIKPKMRVATLLSVAPLLLGFVAATEAPVVERAVPVERAIPAEELVARDLQPEKRACVSNGCKCMKGLRQGQYCGACVLEGKPVITAKRNPKHVYECSPSGACCDYGVGSTCNTGHGRCGPY